MSKDKANQPANDGGDAVERRFFPITARAAKDEGDKMQIGGYGAVFNQYTNMGWYAEVVEPGFFDGIKDDRCACLFNHDANQVLGRKKNNTLAYTIDETGVDYTSILPSHRADVYELINDGYIYESSFAFTVLESKWAEVDRSLMEGKMSQADIDYLSYGGKISVRYLTKGKELFDLSPVTYGAFEGTTSDTRIAKRSFEAWKRENGQEPEPQIELEKPEQDLELRAYMQAAAEYLSI